MSQNDGGAGEGGEFEWVLVYPPVLENIHNHLHAVLMIISCSCLPKMEAEKVLFCCNPQSKF